MDGAGPSNPRLASAEKSRGRLSGLTIHIPSDEDLRSSSSEIGNEYGGNNKKLDVGSSSSANVSVAENTDLHVAVLSNHPDSVAELLRGGAIVNAHDTDGNTPLLLAGTNLKVQDRRSINEYEKVVSTLLEFGADVNYDPKLNSRKCTGEHEGKEFTTALHTAALLGSLVVVELLVKRGADALYKNSSGFTPTHQAASTGSEAILKAMLLPNMDDELELVKQVNVTDDNKFTPLHYAAAAGSHECVECLIKNGANLSHKNRSGVSAAETVLLQLPHAKSFLLSVLDSCISGSEDIPVGKRGYKIELDFYILCPFGCKTQTDILSALFTAKSLPTARCRAIFRHPLVEAFICYKWNYLRWYFLATFFINLLFVLTLTCFVTEQFCFHYDNYSAKGSVRYVNLLLSLIVLAMIVGQCSVRFKYYARQYETWTIGISALLSVIWTIASICDYAGDYSGVMTPLWMRHLLSVQLPLAWTGLMLLLGRFPMCGARALLFGLVLKNVLLTFLVLGFIIIGFSLSFFVQFHDVSPQGFENPWKSFANTVVMMTGEYGYLEIFGMAESFGKLSFSSRIVFLCFVLIATVVLMNLIVGLAVTDTQMLGMEGEWRCLKKKAESMDLLECLLPRLTSRSYLKEKMNISIYETSNDVDPQNSLILPKRTVKALIAVANKNAVRKRMSKEKISITIPLAMEGSFEHEVFTTMEVLFQQISQLLSKYPTSKRETENEVPGILRKNRNFFREAVKKAMRGEKKT